MSVQDSTSLSRIHASQPNITLTSPKRKSTCCFPSVNFHVCFEHIAAVIKAIFLPFRTPNLKNLTPIAIGYLNRWQIKHLPSKIQDLDLNIPQRLALVKQAAYMTTEQVRDFVYETEESVIKAALQNFSPRQVSSLQWAHDDKNYVDAIAIGAQNLDSKDICFNYGTFDYAYKHKSLRTKNNFVKWVQNATGEQLLRIMLKVQSFEQVHWALEAISESQKSYLVENAHLFASDDFRFSDNISGHWFSHRALLIEISKFQPALFVQIAKATTLRPYDIHEPLFFLPPKERQEVLADYIQKVSDDQSTSLLGSLCGEANNRHGIGTRGLYVELFDQAYDLILSKYPSFSFKFGEWDVNSSFVAVIFRHAFSIGGGNSHFWEGYKDHLKQSRDHKVFKTFFEACSMRGDEDRFGDYSKNLHAFIGANRDALINFLNTCLGKKEALEMAFAILKENEYHEAKYFIQELDKDKGNREIIAEAFARYLHGGKHFRLKEWAKDPKYNFDQLLYYVSEDTKKVIGKKVLALLKQEEKAKK